MKLFAILICFALQRYWGWNHHKGLLWIGPYAVNVSDFLAKSGIKNYTLIAIIILIPVGFVIGGVDYLLRDVWFNSLEILFNILVLFFCIDSRNLRHSLADYLQAWQRGDSQAAFQYGTEFLKTEESPDLVTLISAVTRKIFSSADFYIFSVLFWYILTGITGAFVYAFITYSALHINSESPLAKAMNQLQKIVDWLPVRLTAFTYALMGHFGFAINYLGKHLFSGLQATREMSTGAGLAALEIEKDEVSLADIDENKKALALVHRAVVFWIVMIAIFTLVSWVR